MRAVFGGDPQKEIEFVWLCRARGMSKSRTDSRRLMTRMITPTGYVVISGSPTALTTGTPVMTSCVRNVQVKNRLKTFDDKDDHSYRICCDQWFPNSIDDGYSCDDIVCKNLFHVLNFHRDPYCLLSRRKLGIVMTVYFPE
jgi:hypothetical protein